jgi:hypothetical protein
VLPPLHARWIERVLGGPAPTETRADCGRCSMVARPDDPPAPGELSFDPALKCCTYQPRLANYAAGRILDDPTAWGRAALERRIASGAGVSPLGILRPDGFVPVGRDRFGLDRSIRCPYLDPAGDCGIWAHREAMCVGYFCRHDQGRRGLEFWRWLQLLLVAIERELAAWCADELGAAADDWGPWRPADLYRAAGARVETLSWDDVQQIGGTEVKVLARTVAGKYERLRSCAMPERLAVGTYQVLRAGRVVGYRSTDPIDVDLAALSAFDGGASIAEARARGCDLDEVTLRRLVDFEVLVPAHSLVRRR